MFFNYDSTTYNDAPQKDLHEIATELVQSIDSSHLRTSVQVGHCILTLDFPS